MQISAIEEQEQEAAYAVLYQLRTHLSFEEFKLALGAQKESGYDLFGAFDPELVGLIGMRPVSTLARGFHLHVDDLVVAEGQRGKGIGKLLLEFAEAHARAGGMTSVFLDSVPDALEFYERAGFKPHTATLMHKAL